MQQLGIDHDIPHIPCDGQQVAFDILDGTTTRSVKLRPAYVILAKIFIILMLKILHINQTTSQHSKAEHHPADDDLYPSDLTCWQYTHSF